MRRPVAATVYGDSARLQQIAWNLLSNAVKFTPDGGVVRIQLRTVSDAAEMVVADSGDGIPANFLPYVFEPFRQADGSTTRPHAGLGLGLSIVKQLVEAHGGTVDGDQRRRRTRRGVHRAAADCQHVCAASLRVPETIRRSGDVPQSLAGLRFSSWTTTRRAGTSWRRISRAAGRRC